MNYESNNSNPKLEKDASFIISSNPKAQYKNSYYIRNRFNKNFNFINKKYTNETSLSFLYSSSLSKYTHLMIGAFNKLIIIDWEHIINFQIIFLIENSFRL